jgi:hypothetical protein
MFTGILVKKTLLIRIFLNQAGWRVASPALDYGPASVQITFDLRCLNRCAIQQYPF